MAYTFWSVVFGEQPSASKWNILGTNDAGFRDGTNFALNNNVIPASALATSSIKIGQTLGTTTVTPSASTETTIISLAVTVPSGGRDLLLIFTAPQVLPNDGTRMRIDFKEGATVLQRYYHIATGAGEVLYCTIPAPSAGSHTYILTSTRDSGAGTTQYYADTAGATIRLLALMI